MAIAPQDIDMAARFRRQTKTTGVKRPSRILDPRNKIQIQKEKVRTYLSHR